MRRAHACALLLVVVAAACSGDDDTSVASSADATSSAPSTASEASTTDTTDDAADDADTSDADASDADTSDARSGEDDTSGSSSDESESQASDESASQAPPSTVPPPTSPAATAPPDAPPVGVDTLPPVAVSEQVRLSSGLILEVVQVDRIDVQATRPGDTAGPAVAVNIAATNDSPAVLDLIGFTVTATGPDEAPLGISSSEPAAPLEGVLEPGQTRDGWYVFRVDGDGEVTLRLEDAIASDAAIVVV